MSDDYSPQEIQKIKEFRSRVIDILKDDYQKNDAFLIMWLRARQLNIDKAEDMLRNSLEWRKVNKVDQILETESIPVKYLKQTPFAYCGQDKITGCPVFLYMMGRHDTRSMLEELGPEKFIRMNIYFTEMFIKMMKDMSVKSGRPVTQFIEIIDLEGYSYRQLSSKLCRDTMTKIQSMCDLNYPEMIKHITLVNTPKIFTVLFSFMRPLIPKETLEKIDIHGTDVGKWKQVLETKYPMELIPKHWGGTLEGTDEFCSQSSIWIFGPLPLQFFTDADGDGFIKERVKARDRLQIPYDISKPGTLTWKFKTDSSLDIGFGVFFENEEMIPIKRIQNPGTIQDGILECKNPGKYIIVFDNTYSYTRAKTIHHKIIMIPDVPNLEENDFKKLFVYT